MVFRVVEEKIEIESHFYTAFGIAVAFDNGEEQIFSDISFNFEDVNSFVNQLNSHNIESVHFNDLIEDYMEK